MLKNNEIDSTLLRYLLNELNAEERQSVQKWISEKRENRIYFENFRTLYHQLQYVVQSEAIQSRYSVLSRKIHLRSWRRRLSGIAAGILLLLGTGIGIYLFYHQSEPENIATTTSAIQPGSSHAILHLSSGEKINLEGNKGQLQEKDGTTIRISENGTLDYNPSAPTATPEILANRLEIPRGGEFKLTLSDGTEIWLNSETELQYPTTFTAKERIVKLKGEAYFKVAKNPRFPFIVMVNDIQVKVYGTQFNINTQNKGKIETVLVNGSIGITYHGEEIRLTPSQKAELSEKTQKISVENVNVLPYIAWKEGNFMFHNESLESIMEKLSRWYDIQVFYTNEYVKTIHLSGMLERYKDVNELFHHFEKISSAKFIVKGNTVTIQ
ncbi:MAG: FecR domain-containing protein [Odoribacter splanchnicus]